MSEIPPVPADAADAAPGDAVRGGFIALVGRPNVGKSTLLNALIGSRLSIVTAKPHTTRQRILGVVHRDDGSQLAFVDTPGLHERRGRPLNRLMNDAARQAMHDADVILVLVDASRVSEDDETVLEAAFSSGRPVVIGVNKTDRIRPRDALLPVLAGFGARWPAAAAIVPLSARRQDNLERLLDALAPLLPEGPALFPPDMVTDRDMAYRVAEQIREKLMIQLRDELPYGIAVTVERLVREDGGRWQVAAAIWVEQARHKGMVIGRGGQLLKTVGTQARQALIELLGGPVHLELWVQERRDWSRDERALRELGYSGEG
ncbi:MAG: GTPase Era [Gammaproteobacteria bacterium]|nr:GTPase Era [Gammaproteobacteria bacterium]